MKIWAKNIRGKLWDLDTGEEILRPIWFDVEAGLFEAFQVTPMGRIRRNPRGDRLTMLCKGRIRFEPNVCRLKGVQSGRAVQKCYEIGRKCETCTRDATWQVADETPLSPVRKRGKLMGRGRLTGLRFYCDFHYQGPRIVDAKGEVMQTVEDGYGVRPQGHS